MHKKCFVGFVALAASFNVSAAEGPKRKIVVYDRVEATPVPALATGGLIGIGAAMLGLDIISIVRAKMNEGKSFSEGLATVFSVNNLKASGMRNAARVLAVAAIAAGAASKPALEKFLPEIRKEEIDPEKTAVIVVDVQNDFTEAGLGKGQKGALACAGTDVDYLASVAKATKDLIEALPDKHVCVSQDEHTDGHVSFAEGKNGPTFKPGGTWPKHCVASTAGQQLAFEIAKSDKSKVHFVKKGTKKNTDSYSAFYDNSPGPEGQKGGAAAAENGLKTSLKNKPCVKKVVVFGLATDVCVDATVRSAKKLLGKDVEVVVVSDLCRGVFPWTHKAALRKMAQDGIKVRSNVKVVGAKPVA